MKISKSRLVQTITLLLLSQAASAANTINFQGEVTTQTCAVSINGTTAPLILLPTVSTTSLATAGSTAGQTPFTISLTGCTAPTTTATSVKTIFVGNNLNANGRIGNIGTATLVSLQLVDPLTPTTPLDVTGSTGATGLSIAVGATTASKNFAVRYYAEGAATAGTVLGSVQYSVSYL